MTRIFNRGELKHVLLTVLDALGEGHGYAIMQELQRRVGTGWQPSPGAIYPALLTLEESGSISAVERDGLRVYSLTATGRRVLEADGAAPHWRDLSLRADSRHPRTTLGTVLDRFTLGLPRRTALTPEQAADIDAALTQVRATVTAILNEGDDRG